MFDKKITDVFRKEVMGYVRFRLKLKPVEFVAPWNGINLDGMKEAVSSVVYDGISSEVAEQQLYTTLLNLKLHATDEAERVYLRCIRKIERLEEETVRKDILIGVMLELSKHKTYKSLGKALSMSKCRNAAICGERLIEEVKEFL